MAEDSHDAWIRQVVNLDDRHDSVPACNGVVLGSWWRNVHTGKVARVAEIWLAGQGTYAGHQECILWSDEGEYARMMGSPLFSLQEHWEQVQRRPEPTADTIIVDDGSGQLGFDVETDDWERVEPQPYVWHGRSSHRDPDPYRAECAWVMSVRSRPEGTYVEWEGEYGIWRRYENEILTINGFAVGAPGRYTSGDRAEQIVAAFPESSPRQVAA